MEILFLKGLVMGVMRLVGLTGEHGVNAVLNVVAVNSSELEVVKEEIVMEHQKWQELVIRTLVKV